ncbi:MAG TPA: molybdopterin cofactor-binding domain-containing protein [Dehalococcoidia bacterium]|nr:molybdopterin cofactor-binding domain-containing protein [Dehalococcoidia bacterium]
MEYSVVGKSVPRPDSFSKALGQAQYVEDIVLPRMLHGKVLHSPHAHARILDIDTSKAERLPGVKGVVTGKEIPKRTFGIVPKAHDQYALEIDKVRFKGDNVAAVAAIDEDTALEALSLIKVDYEPLPAVFGPEEAMRPGAPLIHEVANNVSASIFKTSGDVEKGFAEADYVREDRFYHQGVNHAPIEPHGALALHDGRGKFTVWSGTQIPFFLRRNLAKTLGVPERDVRVIKPHVGGGFGQKIDMFTKDFAAAWLARKTGRPVRFIYTREEVFTCTRQRHPAIIYLKTGIKKDGTITAQECRFYADGGAYNSTAPLMITGAAFFMTMPYLVQNVRFEGYHVYTNKPVGGAMRGHGLPQIRFACDSSLDMVAHDAGLDPVEVRRRNALHANEDNPMKLRILTCGLTEAIQKTSESMQWKEKWGRLPRGRGIGFACSGCASGISNMSHIGSGAIVKIQQDDGSISLLTGAADIGQGAESVLCQIVAEVFGVSMDHMRITAADTELTPLDPGTFGSGVTLRAGNAARLAALDARRQIAEVVAERLEANPGDLLFRDERIHVKGSPERGLSWNEAIKAVQYADRDMPIVGHGFYTPDAVEPTTLLTTEGNISPAYSFMAQGAEVTVDLETGLVEPVSVVTGHDCGRAINPMAVEGQLDGSAVGGTGQAFYEDLDWGEGWIKNPNFLDYKLPTSLDVPKTTTIAVETNDPNGPFGAKEAGEGTQIPTAAAMANAVFNAAGVRIRELPITPEKIVASLERQAAKP